MSKFIMLFGVCLFDATAAVMSVLHSTSGLIVLCASILTSFVVAMISRTISSIVKPNYFWTDQS